MDLSYIKDFREGVGKFDTERKKKQTPPQDIECISDLGKSDAVVKYDLYYKKGTADKLPVIVDIHGGGWIYGDKKLNDIYIMHLANKGFAVVSVDYRLVPEVSIVEQVQDIFTSLNDLTETARKYPVMDLNNVFLVGDSAGGHLATLVYAVATMPRLQTVFSVRNLDFKIRALGLSHPVVNPAKAKGKRLKSTVKLLFPNKELLINSTWYNMADLSVPPVYLISCGADKLSPYSKQLNVWLKKKNADYVFDFYKKKEYPHLSHVFDVTYPHYSEAQKSIDDMLKFFKAHSVIAQSADSGDASGK